MNEENEIHDRQARAVASAVFSLTERGDFSSSAIIEGAVKGATAVAMGAGSPPGPVADLLEEIAGELRALELPRLRVVET